MKRAGNLIEKVISDENLAEAFLRASRGKRTQRIVRRFAANWEVELARLRRGILRNDLPLGQFHVFEIRDPKPRLIHAAPFWERVVHHAVIRPCEAIFDRGLIEDCYACRVGKGQLRATERAAEFAGRFRYFLKMDMRKYFDSISHPTLMGQLRGRFKDVHVLRLWEHIIRSYEAAPGRGVPIGNLTSQYFANGYLNPLDRWAKNVWRFRGYVRYMDDVVVWSDSKMHLQSFARACPAWLEDHLQLGLKAAPFMNRTEFGMDFLGYRVLPRVLRVARRSRERVRCRLRQLESAWRRGEIDEWLLQRKLTALTAFVAPADRDGRFRRQLLGSERVFAQ